MSKTKLLLIYWAIYGILCLISFLPWAYYSDRAITFSGFYSYENVYGKPSILLLFLACINGVLLFSSALWTRYLSLGIGSLFFAYGIRTFYLYSSCYNSICPVVLLGLWLMMICVFALFVLSLFGKVRRVQ